MNLNLVAWKSFQNYELQRPAHLAASEDRTDAALEAAEAGHSGEAVASTDTTGNTPLYVVELIQKYFL